VLVGMRSVPRSVNLRESLTPEAPCLQVNGTMVFDAKGQPLRDANGNPITVAPAGAHLIPPPPAGAAAFPGNITLPNGDPAALLPTPTCTSPFASIPGKSTCNGTSEAPVCLSPDQLVPSGTSKSRQVVYPRFFQGKTLEEMKASEPEILRVMSQAAGGKPVTLSEWEVVPSSAGASRRRLLESSVGGVRGYFVMQNGDVSAIKAVINELDRLGRENPAGENGGITALFSKPRVCSLLPPIPKTQSFQSSSSSLYVACQEVVFLWRRVVLLCSAVLCCAVLCSM
jgi:hypothetical protein